MKIYLNPYEPVLYLSPCERQKARAKSVSAILQSSFEPKMPFYYMQIYYHLVIPNAKVAAIGFSMLSLGSKQTGICSKEKKLEQTFLYFFMINTYHTILKISIVYA